MSENMILPEEWNGWKVKECIGGGSFGTVYKIEKSDENVQVTSALKILHIPADESVEKQIRQNSRSEEAKSAYLKDMVNRFANEIRIMYELQGDSNIVSIQDHLIKKEKDADRYTIYIRMEYLTPLSEYVTEHIFGREETIQLGIELCEALKRCEDLHIIHRDIKPDNIFVSPSGTFKLGDFGVSREIQEMFGSYTTRGTISYMAPEVFHGLKYGHNADIYSVGLILYKYMNGNVEPFLDGSRQFLTMKEQEEALSRRMGGEELPLPSEAKDALGEIIKKACDYQPQKRYQSARDLQKDLIACKNVVEEKRKNLPKFQNRIILPIILIAAFAVAGGGYTIYQNQKMSPIEESGITEKEQTKTETEQTETEQTETPASTESSEPTAVHSEEVYFLETSQENVTDNEQFNDAASVLYSAVLRFSNGDQKSKREFAVPDASNVQSLIKSSMVNTGDSILTFPIAGDGDGKNCLVNVVAYAPNTSKEWAQLEQNSYIRQMIYDGSAWKINNYQNDQQDAVGRELRNSLTDYYPDGFKEALAAGKGYRFGQTNYVFIDNDLIYKNLKSFEPKFLWEDEDENVNLSVVFANGQSDDAVVNQFAVEITEEIGNKEKTIWKLNSEECIQVVHGTSVHVVYRLEKILDEEVDWSAIRDSSFKCSICN